LNDHRASTLAGCGSHTSEVVAVKKLAIGMIVTVSVVVGLAGAFVGGYWGALQTNTPVVPDKLSPGVAIRQEGLAGPQAELGKTITTAPAKVMNQSGLVAAMGGARVKLSSSDPQEVFLPIPQLADGQVPICYFISCTPPNAATEFRLRKRADCNVVVSVRLVGNNQEVQLTWSSVVLLVPRNATPNTTPPDAYRAATPCVQAQAAEITKLAAATWPATGKTADFAANIQRHIREMKKKERPRSLDALGILQSGESGICTANANLASALMRAKGIACRSVAVIPPTSQRLEMHRIVEFFDNNHWHSFDPSSLQTDIPAKPWQNIIMAKTTGWDEQMAMKPRLGAMLGCPYGQEVEMLSSGVSLWGQDFFWTLAKPLAEFEPTEEGVRLAIEGWNRYVETGILSQGQLKAVSAKTVAKLTDDLRTR
jgi:hypothetical protein